MNEVKDGAKAGFVYRVECFARQPDGGLMLVNSEVCHNLIPREGIEYMLNAAYRGGAQFANWYVGVYSANYIPSASSSASTLPAEAIEVTAYRSETRPNVVFGNPTNGRIDNTANLIEIEFSQEVTVQGGFISSSSSKGASMGVLASVVRFSSPKQIGAGGVIRLNVSQQIMSE